jgi:hypothetical protein
MPSAATVTAIVIIADTARMAANSNLRNSISPPFACRPQVWKGRDVRLIVRSRGAFELKELETPNRQAPRRGRQLARTDYCSQAAKPDHQGPCRHAQPSQGRHRREHDEGGNNE